MYIKQRASSMVQMCQQTTQGNSSQMDANNTDTMYTNITHRLAMSSAPPPDLYTISPFTLENGKYYNHYSSPMVLWYIRACTYIREQVSSRQVQVHNYVLTQYHILLSLISATTTARWLPPEQISGSR